MKTAFIYALCEPGTRTVRYIGVTTKTLEVRHRQHCKACSATKKTHLGCWLKHLLFAGTPPDLLKLAEVSLETWREEESRYIRAARMLGMALVNATDGGEGLINPSPETRQKMSAARLGKPLSEETRARMSIARQGVGNPNFGKIRTPEHCAAIRASRAGKGPLSPEHRAAIRRGLLSHYRSQEQTQK